jgi:hypothetical protein
MGLGTAATQNVGTAAGNVVQLDATTAKLPAVDGSQLTNLPSAAKLHGQCILTLSSGSLKLAPKNGNLLVVNGTACTVPDAGVTLAATGLTASTVYFIYATASAGAVNALVASTTGHSVSTTAGNKGVEIMTGDDTKTLVGIVFTNATPGFDDSATKRNVRSWFNPPFEPFKGNFTVSRSTGSTTAVEVNTEIRCEFVLFSGEVAEGVIYAQVANGTGGNYTFTNFGWDGTGDSLTAIAAFDSAGNTGISVTPVQNKTGLSEGHHYVTLLGYVTAGTGSWLINADRNTVLTGGIRR